MHTSGKVLTWFTVVLALVAIFLGVKMFDVQNSWARKAGQLQQQIAQTEQTVEQKTAELSELRAELARATIVWDRYWTGVKAVVSQDGQIMTENLGRNQGLGGLDAENRPAPTVHLFAESPEGESMYAGSYVVADLREQQALLRPSQFMAYNPQQLSQYTLWRVRSTIPQSARDRLTEVHNSLYDANRLLADKQRHLATQNEIIADSQKVRDLRLSELNGGGEGTPGLIARLTDVERERNQELAELDQLRREAHGLYERIVSLVEQNEYLARSLPGAQQVVSQQTAD